jgi:hypothetical protein
MGRLTILALAIAAAVSVVPRNASAEKYYPWCAWYDEWTYSCGFTTLEQCRATISGVGGMCRPNSYGPPADSPRGRRRY